MSSYEEMVVDRAIGTAWATFRDRLAEHLADEAGRSQIVLCPSPDPEADAPFLRLMWTFGSWEVALEAEGPLVPPYQLDREQRVRLRELGFRLREGAPCLLVPDHLVDQVAHIAVTVLRDVWGVLMPTLVDTAGLDLVGEAVTEPEVGVAHPSNDAAVPDLVESADPEVVARWTDHVLGEVFGHPPRRDPDGDIRVSGHDGGRAVVAQRADGRIEVWSVLARQVRFKAAHRAADRLSSTYRDVRFFLAQDVLVASVVVESDPFVPRHVVAAMRRVLEVSRRTQDLEYRLRRRRAVVAADDLDDALMTLFAGIWAKDIDADELAEELSGGDVDVLARWQRTARVMAARFVADDDMSPSERHARRRTRSKWQRVERVVCRTRAACEEGAA